MNKGIMAAIVAVILVIVVGGLIVLFWFVPIPTIRDLAIIALAVLAFIGTLLAVALVGVLLWLVLVIRGEIVPLLNKLTATVETVRGTTAFVSEEIVSPIIKVASAAAGAQGMVQALFRNRKKSGGNEA
jgi:hypothetical protein